ncbi:MAG: aminotransferase class I/II-fold pyridoxal phosphate-dependent enzyme [Bacteroidetes bacterium]|nr:aminotransferase class I/II-fold pyridoxal phosphate-dependent enzyme [Bacteroidota bacterium]
MTLIPQIQSKLPNTGTTIFTQMSALAKQFNAINLSQGFPDFECSDELKDAIYEAVKNGYNQYAPMPGIQPLREIISEKIFNIYKRKYNPDTEITIVPGGTIGIFTAINTVVNKGDEVIIIEPAYDSYLPAVQMCGGKPVFSSLSYPDFKINWDEIKTLINPRTKLLIINSPQNPGTSVISKEDLEMLDKITAGTGIFIISDEVYEHIIFDNVTHQSLILNDNLASRSFIVSSLGKTYHVTGWKTGYVIAPEPMSQEFRKIYQYNAFCSFAPAQWAFYKMLSIPRTYKGVSKFYEEKRNFMEKLLKNSKFKVLHSAGSYFQLLDFSEISTISDFDFAVWLTKEHKVATIPLSSFYHNKKDDKLIRICFAKRNETLEKAAEILNSIK